MIAFASVHAYIAFHLISWHVFGIEIWGKTAMMGVPSLAKGTINCGNHGLVNLSFNHDLGTRVLRLGLSYAWCHRICRLDLAKAEGASVSQPAREKCSR